MQLTVSRSSSSRRGFLGRAGLLAGASALLSSPAKAERFSKKLKLFAEGPVPLGYALSPAPLEFPPDLSVALSTGQLEFRQRVTFPWNDRDVMEIQVFLAPPRAPLPLPAPPPATNPPTIALVYIGISDVIVSDSPKPHLAMFGEVIANPIVSPFGDLTGYAMGFATGFKLGNPTTEFIMLGGFAAATHTSWSPAAIGSLEFAKNLLMM